MSEYAEGTTVSVINSRMEVEKIILKYAGQSAAYSYGQMEGQAAVSLVAHGRRVRFTVPIPTLEEAKKGAMRKRDYYEVKDIPRRQEWVDQESRRRWRCLVLAIKAKLEVVESGIATFEEEFLAHIVNPAGQTVYEAIQQATANGQRLLPPVNETNVVEISQARKL
jgi:hypothetical protein